MWYSELRKNTHKTRVTAIPVSSFTRVFQLCYTQMGEEHTYTTRALSHIHTHAHTHSHKHTYTRARANTHTRSLSLSFSHTHTHNFFFLPLSYTHTHTHTHKKKQKTRIPLSLSHTHTKCTGRACLVWPCPGETASHCLKSRFPEEKEKKREHRVAIEALSLKLATHTEQVVVAIPDRSKVFSVSLYQREVPALKARIHFLSRSYDRITRDQLLWETTAPDVSQCHSRATDRVM